MSSARCGFAGRDLGCPDHSHGSIYAADDLPYQIFLASRIAADELQGLRLELIALLREPQNYISAGFEALLAAMARHLHHRKEYKNVPTDK